MSKKILFVLTMMMIVSGAAQASADQFLKRVNDWLIMRIDYIDEDTPRYCYMVSMPYRTKAHHANKVREPHFIVIYRAPNEYTIKVDMDFFIDAKRGVVVDIDSTPRLLEPAFDSEVVHTYSSVQDIAMINDLMLTDGYFTVRSFDKDNNQALDYYSLKGFGKALRLMTRSCKY